MPHRHDRAHFFDDDVPGFGLRVRTSGARSWLVQYAVHGKTKKITLGGPPLVSLGAARARAREILAAVKLGSDPAREKAEAREAAANTLGALIPAFIDRQRQRLKPRTSSRRRGISEAREAATRARRQSNRPACRRAAPRTDRARQRSRVQQLRPRKSFGAVHMDGESRSHRCESGRDDARAVENGARQRVLSDDEIATIWRALDDAEVLEQGLNPHAAATTRRC